MSEYARKLKKRLKTAQYNQKRVSYLWCREHHKSDRQHYHAALFLNGSIHQNAYSILELIREIWTKWDQPAPPFITTPSHMAHRNDLETIQAAYKRLSYLAKTNTKQFRPPKTRDYSASMLNPHPSKHAALIDELIFQSNISEVRSAA